MATRILDSGAQFVSLIGFISDLTIITQFTHGGEGGWGDGTFSGEVNTQEYKARISFNVIVFRR